MSESGTSWHLSLHQGKALLAAPRYELYTQSSYTSQAKTVNESFEISWGLCFVSSYDARVGRILPATFMCTGPMGTPSVR